MSFKDKVVLITGGSAGIGAATAILFAKEGANVAIVARNEEKLNSIAEFCKKAGAITLPIKADISKDADAKMIIQKTIEEFGKLDVVVNNAGAWRKIDILDENYMETFDLIMNTNLRSVAVMTNLAAPHLIKTKGNIVNISSVSSTRTKDPSFSCYKTSKAGLDHFTRCIALELAPKGVRVNCVNPGPTATDIFDAAGLTGVVDFEAMKKNTALGKFAEAEEVADLILYIASDKAKSITGSVNVIDNGYVLK